VQSFAETSLFRQQPVYVVDGWLIAAMQALRLYLKSERRCVYTAPLFYIKHMA
jgi:hypothetical protein